jgi:hypothetical protein
MGVHSRAFEDRGDIGQQVFVLELRDRQVDGDAQGCHAFLTPFYVLLAGCPQHPFADGHDQTGFLGDADELHWRHRP